MDIHHLLGYTGKYVMLTFDDESVYFGRLERKTEESFLLLEACIIPAEEAIKVKDKKDLIHIYSEMHKDKLMGTAVGFVEIEITAEEVKKKIVSEKIISEEIAKVKYAHYHNQ